jgi:hypothetical protein
VILLGSLDRDLTDQRRSGRGEAHLGFRLAGGVTGGEAAARDLAMMVLQVFPIEMEWSTRFGGVRRTHGCGQHARYRPGATRSGDWSCYGRG